MTWLNPTRRRFLAILTATATTNTESHLALGPRPCAAAKPSPTVELLYDPPICQARARPQDFVALRYRGVRAADGAPFDERYASRPLVYELGAFYLPGVDDALRGRCVGTKLRLSYDASPRLRDEDERILATGTPIALELELVTIKYSLFGEKMRNQSSTYWFAPEPLTLTSAADARGHASPRTPEVRTENFFAIDPTKGNIVSTGTGKLEPLSIFKGGR